MKRRKGSLAAKIIVLVLAVPAVITLVSNQIKINAEREQMVALQHELEEQRKANAAYSDALNATVDDEYIASAARDKLGMVSPGERVFVDISN